jgi:hypothetical protein
MTKLTTNQRDVLLSLPDLPSDGRFCRAGRLRTAESLVRLGYAKKVGSGYFNGGFYARTTTGKGAVTADPAPQE